MGTPGRSSGKTSEYLHISRILSKETPSIRVTAQYAADGEVVTNSMHSPSKVVRLTVRWAHLIVASNLVNHPIPKITSIPEDSKMMRLSQKSFPIILRLTLGQVYAAFMSPPGELPSMG